MNRIEFLFTPWESSLRCESPQGRRRGSGNEGAVLACFPGVNPQASFGAVSPLPAHQEAGACD